MEHHSSSICNIREHVCVDIALERLDLISADFNMLRSNMSRLELKQDMTLLNESSRLREDMETIRCGLAALRYQMYKNGKANTDPGCSKTRL